MKRVLLLVFLSSWCLHAQKNVYLKILPKVNGSDLALGVNYLDAQGVSFNLDHFNYYLSGLRITHDGGQLLDLSTTVFLVKPNVHDLYLGLLEVTNIESIQFNIGVPPNLNTASGPDAIDISLYPSHHPLSFQDPSMYWGWSAGYMFLVTSGFADSDSDGLPDAYFELHNLGENNYIETPLIPIVQTNINNDQIDVYLDCNIEKWLEGVPVQTIGIMHGSLSYNESSMSNVSTQPVFTQPFNASLSKINSQDVHLFYSSGMLFWKNMPSDGWISVTDLTGKTLMNENLSSHEGSFSLTDFPFGVYIVKAVDNSGVPIKLIKLFH
jgi:hypothetical protein